jgi:hypothetical protein
MAPIVSVLRSADELAAFRHRAGRMCVVAVVRDLDAANVLRDVLADVASRVEDVLFAMLVDVEHDAATQHIVLMRTFDEPRLFYRDTLDAEKV